MQLLNNFHELTLQPKNAKELKGLILQLAVQGKLTAQWRALNKKSVLDFSLLKKYSKKNKSFLENESQSIDEIEVPKSWLKLKFKTLFEMQGGSQPPKSMFVSELQDGYIQLFQIRDFGKRTIPVYVPKESVSKFCSTEDVMIGRYGASIGKVFYGKNGAYNVALVRLIWEKKLLEQDFVYQVFSSRYIQEFFKNCTRSAQAGFNKADMGELVIPIPPIDEQKAIVSIVGQLFKEVEQLEQLTQERVKLKEDFATSALQQLATNNTAKEWEFIQEHFNSFFTEESNIKKLRETILQLAVQGKLTTKWRSENPDAEPAEKLLKRIKAEKEQLIKDKKIKKEKPLPLIADNEIPYELPDGWSWCSMEDLMTINGGVTKGKKDTSKMLVSPYLRVANVQRGFLDLSIMKEISVSRSDYEKYQLELEDLLMIEGGDPDKVGRCAMWKEEIPGCIYQNHVFRVRTYKKDSVNNYYILLFVNSPVSRSYYLNCAKRTTNLASINKTQMRGTPIALPPFEEQKSIVSKVNSLMSLCDQLEAQVKESKAVSEKLMQSVLREVFEGKEERVDDVVLDIAAEKEEKYG